MDALALELAHESSSARTAWSPTCTVARLSATFSPAHRGGTGPPLVCLHGFTDTWRTWELVLPRLERRHDVLAPTLPGHAGGPPVGDAVSAAALADWVERTMDDAGIGRAHIVGNSLGGHLALELAARDRAESVVALAPGGGWARGDESSGQTLAFFPRMQELLRPIAPQAEAVLSSAEGRRRATRYTTTNFEHIPVALLAHQMRGAAACEAVGPFVEAALRDGWQLDAARIACPVRVVWGAADRLLPWPEAAARYRRDWLPHADWVVLDGVGHCPQLDVPLETAELILGRTAR
jgi:pimeloyl-ACP methyl ester carboxylesterase